MTMNLSEASPAFHPLANAFPLLDEDSEEFQELMADISKNGLNNPIIKFEGKILDGRNRWRACQRLGVPHREVQFDDERDPIAFVWSQNAVRRQLDAAQKAMAAEQLATASRGYQRRRTDGSTTEAEMTIPEAAKATGASVASIERARRVRKGAVPKVVEAVEKGELELAPAERLAKLPPEKQEEIMATTPVEDVPKLVPDPRPKRPRKGAEAPAEDAGGPAHPAPEGVAETDSAPLFQEPEIPEPPTGQAAPLVTRAPNGRQRRPITVLRDQLKASSSEGEAARLAYWTKHADQIKELDPKELDQFVKDMRANASNITKLLKLIKEHKGS